MKEKLVRLIKQYAEVFLLDAGEFFPFGVAINNLDQIIPLAAYIEDEHDRPESAALINCCEQLFIQALPIINIKQLP